MKSLDPKVPEALPGEYMTHKYRNHSLTCDQRSDMLSTRGLDSALVANMSEDIVMTHHDECELAEVRVRGEVLQRVQL